MKTETQRHNIREEIHDRYHHLGELTKSTSSFPGVPPERGKRLTRQPCMKPHRRLKDGIYELLLVK